MLTWQPEQHKIVPVSVSALAVSEKTEMDAPQKSENVRVRKKGIEIEEPENVFEKILTMLLCE